MSRIGNKVIVVPNGVEVKDQDRTITVKGPKGEMSFSYSDALTLTVEGNEISISRSSDKKDVRALHGTTRALINNMIIGVSEGFKKELDLIGVGYRAQLQGKKLVLNVGYSHPVEFELPEGITVEVPSNTKLIVSGYDKEAVGDFSAKVREVRPPEPYKGKGIRYTDEFVRRKEGKTGK
ncbi:50S ribosomal protein L6 [Atopobacter sp. AH10]|uniref:50S ribosomal protein L6 n=1 Tax=Atopobacter sp. AH10 TaxID=2315861 RepID=UPI000EF2535E|nr:50S ribosomal protein L6 [Atopobacter sp. AH10]RLK63836.1 50S ribosomal protein L6 [Atopobacter sp. AH10]